MSRTPLRRVSDWSRRHWEIRMLTTWYVLSSDADLSRRRRSATRVALVSSPACGLVGVAVLVVAAALGRDVTFSVVVGGLALVATACALWRSSTSLTSCAVVLGAGAAIISSNGAISSSLRGPGVALLVVLCVVIVAGCLVRASREPDVAMGVVEEPVDERVPGWPDET